MMKRLLLMCAVAMGSAVAAPAPVLASTDSPWNDFQPFLGRWQCEAKQASIGLDQFQLTYVSAALTLDFTPAQDASHLTTHFEAVSLADEPMFKASSIISYEAASSTFVQYESTEDGAEATLYAPGFIDGCITWHYAPDAASAEVALERDINVQARYCVDRASGVLNIDYSLRYAEHDPVVLMTAQCRQTA